MKKLCRHCGSAPTSHMAAWVESFVSLVVSAPLRPLFVRPSPFFRTERSPLMRALGAFFIQVFLWLQILTVEDVLEKVSSDRTRAIWKEAKKRGIRMEQLLFFGKPLEQSRALLPSKRGGALRFEYFQSIPLPWWLPDGVGILVDDKFFFKKELEKARLPVPKGMTVISEWGARKAFQDIGERVIVKPRDGSRARHTSVHLEDAESVAKAFHIARALSPFVIIEQHVEGSGYRATCVGGVCRGIVHFVRPFVVGDSVHTLEELRNKLNERNARENRAALSDSTAWRIALSHQGYTPESIPSEGTRVVFTEHEEVLPNGGTYEDVTERVPEERRAEIERAATLLGLPVIGFDLMSKDLTSHQEPYYFIEGNSLPFIEVHDKHKNNPPRNIAAYIWDLWEL